MTSRTTMGGDEDDLLEQLLAGAIDDAELGALPPSLREAAGVIRSGLTLFRATSATGEHRASSGTVPSHAMRFGRFRLLDCIGRGGQGSVWRAFDDQHGREVALKFLDGRARGSTQAGARLARERAILAKLSHPGIARALDAGEEAGVPWIAMELIAGEPLARWITHRRRGGFRPPLGDRDAVLAFFARAAHALHGAHEAGVLHRDIKPGNIMVTPDGEPVIVDFGLARDLGPDGDGLTQTGDLLGTPAYLAPEQLTRQSIPADRRTDVYGLGVSLYEAITGRPPFEEPTRERLYAAILTRDAPNPRLFYPKAGRDLAVVIATALEKDRDRRYATAQAMAEDLERLLARRPILARPLSWPAQLVRSARRHPSRTAALGLLVLMAVLSGFLVARWTDLERGRRATREDRVDRLLESAYLALGDGSASHARELFLESLDLVPGSVESWAGLVLSDCRVGDERTARATVAEARRRGCDERAVLVLTRAIAAVATGELDIPEITAGATDLDLFLAGEIALVAAHRGRPEVYGEACDLLHAAVLRMRRVRPLYLYELAHAAHHADRRELVDAVGRDLATRWPESAIAWFWTGFMDLDADPAQAARCFERALDIDPALPKARYDLLRALTVLERDDEVVSRVAGMLESAPRDVELLIARAHSLTSLQRWSEAQATAERALAVAPRNPRALTARGTARFGLGDPGAAADVDAALALDPDLVAALLQRSFMRMCGDDGDGALADLRAAARIAPRDPAVQLSLLRGLLERDQREAAVEVARDMLAGGRVDETARALAALAFVAGRQHDAARPLVDQLLAEGIAKDATRGDLARALIGLGRGAEAGEVLAAATARTPTIRWLEGDALRAQGRLEEAAAAYEEAHATGRERADWRFPGEEMVARCRAAVTHCRAIAEWRALGAGDIPRGDVVPAAEALTMARDWELFLWFAEASRGVVPRVGGLDPLGPAEVQAAAGAALTTRGGAEAERAVAWRRFVAIAEREIGDLEEAEEEETADPAAILTHVTSLLGNPIVEALRHRAAELDASAPAVLESFVGRLHALR